MFIHHVFQRLAFQESAKIIEEELDRAIAPARRMIRAVPVSYTHLTLPTILRV